MRYEQLISLSEKLLKSFNPVIMTLDAHFDDFMKENGKKLFDTEIMFLKQVFSGVIRYEEFLKILTRQLFTTQPGTTNRNDGHLYYIFGYLIIFRLDELPFNEFKKMVTCQDPVKMNVFLQFLFDLNKLEQYVKDKWNDIYDPDYIQNTIIGGIESHIPLMKDLLQSISSKATGKGSDIVASFEESQDDEDEGSKEKKDSNTQRREATKQQPFNLTQPKIKQLPEPIIIPKNLKSNPVPKNLNKLSLQKMQEEKHKKRNDTKQQVIQQYKESKAQPFDFKTEKRPNNIEKVKKEMEEELSSQLLFNKKFARPIMHNQDPAEVKLNAAAILREEMLLQKKLEEERLQIKNLEVNLRDSGEFEEWQREARAKDRLEQLEHQQRKKIEMELARGAAMRAQKEQFSQNKDLVEKIKEEQIVRMQEREEMYKEQVEHKRKLIEQVVEAEKNIVIEKEKVVERNKKVADDAKLEMAKLIERKKMEDEQIRIKREELIMQIRELEKQPRKRTQGYDPTETMGYGLLEEMSLAELRDRLQIVKDEQKKEESDRRQQNHQKKDDYLNSLQKKVHDIKQHRQEQSQQKELEREQQKLLKQKEVELKKKIREEQLIEVQGKIKTKKHNRQDEEEKIAREVKETKLKQQYMNANKAMVEEKAWKSQQDGLEREIKERQNEKLINQERIESIKNKERQILANAAKNLVQTKVDFNKQYDRTLKKAQADNVTLNVQERENKTNNYQNSRQWDLEHSKNMIERDQFKSKLAQMSLDNSRKTGGVRSSSAKNDLKLPPAQYTVIPEENEINDNKQSKQNLIEAK